MTLSRPEARALLESHGLRPKRKLGQNFVVDANTLSRIARLAAIAPGERVLEVGAGMGALSEALLAAGAELRCLEIDPELVELLRERRELDQASIILGDALEFDLDELCPASLAPWALVANLPYNVATPVVLRVLEQAPQVERLLVMVQLEVADRLAAGVGDPAYGAVSLRVAYHATAKVVGKVPPTVFLPQPSVDSGLVSIIRRPKPLVDPGVATEEEIFVLVKQAFGQRRKMLRRSLAGVLDEACFERAGVSPTARPEELDVAAFGRLAAVR